MIKYRGKYPRNIHTVWLRGGVCHVMTNNREIWHIFHNKKLGIRLPKPGQDLETYCNDTDGDLRSGSIAV